MEKIEKKTQEPSPNKLAQIKRDAEDAIESQIQSRSFYDYLSRFNLREEELRGKSILDVGAGEAYFAKQARMKGLGVTALDTMYSIEEGRKKFRNITTEDYLPDAVAGTAEEIPFKDEKFDIITYLFSSFLYTKNRQDIEDGVKGGIESFEKRRKNTGLSVLASRF